jgi:tight adherence protein B
VPELSLEVWRRGRLAVAAGLIMLLGLPALAGAGTGGRAPPAPLIGWLGTGTSFPNRALVLFTPSGSRPSPATVHVTENGTPVRSLSVTPTSDAAHGDYGMVVVVDQSPSMAGKPLSAAVSAVRTLAGLRRAQQELGMVTFDRKATVFAALSSDTASLRRSLSQATLTGRGADVPGAIQKALGQLRQSHVALGAIALVSDGVGQLAPAGSSFAGARAAAAAARVPIFAVGVQDRAASASSLHALAAAAPGRFIQTSPSGLTRALAEISGVATRGDLVRWRSAAHPGRPVNVVAGVDRVPGTVTARYQLVGSSAAGPRPHASRRPAHAAGKLAPAGRLSALPASASVTTPALIAPATAAAAPSFWSSSAAVPAVAGLCGLLVALAAGLLFYRPARRAARVRVGSFTVVPDEGGNDPWTAPPVRRKSIVAKLETGKRWPAFVLDVEIAHSPHTPIYLVQRAAVIGVVVAALAVLLTGSLVAAFVPLLGWPYVLHKLIARAAAKQRDNFRETLPGYLQDLASAIRVGRSFISALTVVVESADEPTKSELERVITDEALGRPVDEALDAAAERLQAPDLGQIALIAALNRRSGANVTEALDRVAEGARERSDLRREVRALTAQAKASSLVLTSLPGFLLVGLMVVSPLYAHPLFHTTMGLVLLGVGAGLVFAGWKAMQKITNVKV